MNLGEEDIGEFRELWRQEFGEDLSPDEARHRASLLLELYALLAQPLEKWKRTGGGARSANHTP